MKGDYYEKFKWINIFKGFGMGTSDLVPGVSGGLSLYYLEFMMTLLAQLVVCFQDDFGLA